MFNQLLQKTLEDIQQLYLLDNIPWIIGCSWGKDSTTVLQLVWNAVASLPAAKRKPVHVITTDTRTEEPYILKHVHQQIALLKQGAAKYQMPFYPHLLQPKVKNSFWVKIIGNGYAKPAQHGKYRWCTSRLKIEPADEFIREKISQYGESYLVLGVRTDESTTRAKSIAKHGAKQIRHNLNPGNYPNSLIYTPITEWKTQDIWTYLLQCENPWGADNQKLFQLYQGATADNECPMVVESGTQSCGKSRFGCWSCTVTRNLSLENTIANDPNKEWMQPLLDLRNELAEFNDRHRRDFRYAGGYKLYEIKVNTSTNVQPQPGRYTKRWRELWLEKLLQAQVDAKAEAPQEFQDIELITLKELSEIRRIWIEEFHYFDDKLPQIYQKIIGKEFKDPRKGIEFQNYIDKDSYEILTELAEENEVNLKLLTSLLGTTAKFNCRYIRHGIYQELDQCFREHSQTDAEKIVSAYQKYLAQQEDSQPNLTPTNNQPLRFY